MNQTDERRAAAIDRIATKRDFRNHVFVYTAVNALLIIVWAATGAGDFWPIWVIGGWGIGLAAHGWQIYGEKPISEVEIQDEMRNIEEQPHRTSPWPR